LVENDDLAGTTNLLKRWFEIPADSRKKMQQSARTCFASRFEIERATDSLLAAIAKS
jgi:hypothetical protein